MPPSWFNRIAAALVSVLLGFGLVGAIAAELGVFVVAVVLFVGGAAAYTIYALGFGAESARAPAAGGRIALLMVLLAAASVVGLGWFHAESMLDTTEPGAINNTARELALEGDLDVEPVAPFSGDVEQRGPAGLFTAIVGAVAWFGRDAMLWTGPVIVGVAILTVFGLAVRLVRPWVAAVVAAGVAVNPAFVAIARDASPEPLTMAFVLAGLAALVDAREESEWRRAAIGGALLGAAALVRFDWVLLAPALAVYMGIELRRTELLDGWLSKRRHNRYVMAMAVGFVAPAGLAVWLVRPDGPVFAADGPGPGWALLVTGGIALGLLVARLRPGRITRPAIQPGYVAAALLVGLLLIGVARPLLIEENGPAVAAVAAAQEAEGAAIDATRTYGEQSAVWLLWYLGPIGAAGAMVGLALVVDRAARDRPGRWTPVLVLAGLTTVVWLLRPGLDPLHPAVMQRFVPLAIPASLLVVAWLVEWLWRQQRLQEFAQTAALVIAAGVLAFPVWFLGELPDAANHVGVSDGITALCDDLGERTAVLVTDAGSGSALALVQPIRGFCELPVAVAQDATATEAQELASAWQASGRRLVLISDDRVPLAGEVAATARPLPTIEWESLESTVTRRPRRVVPGSLQAWLTPVAPAG